MNILFITADQWRGECLSGLGHPYVKTPNLDKLAADGVSFKRNFAQATPCGPSRACIYTGMYMQNHRSVLNGTPLDARHTNIAMEARRVGYRPVLFGYTDVSLDPRQDGSGLDTPLGYEGVLPGMEPVAILTSDQKLWLEDLGKKGYQIPADPSRIFEPREVTPGMENMGRTYAPAQFKSEDSNTAFLVNEAISYISSSGTLPWFVHLSIYSPHPPFVVPEPFNAFFDAGDMPLPARRATPEEEAAQHPWLSHFIFDQRGAPYTYGADSRENASLSDNEVRQIRATYFGMISEVDAQIGRLIDYLKQVGAYDDTFIIFTSDHGEQLGDHWMFAKYGYFDQTFHTPLIIRDPTHRADASRGTVVDAFTESVDLMPTVLDAIGVDIPVQCDGHSLLPFCHNIQPLDWRQEYHAEFDIRSPYEIDEESPFGLGLKRCTVNIICGVRYKYVHFAGLPPLFFDHADDPNEFLDRSKDPAYLERVLEYTQKMLSWRMEHDDAALTDLHLTGAGVIRNLRLSVGPQTG
ncbi:alkaline phosphatase family protein [Mesorhizobium sp. A623]